MTVIDAHHHVWDLTAADYPWLTPDLAALRHDHDLDDVAAQMTGCGVDRVVLVQAADNIDDTKNMFDVAARHPQVAGVVAWVPLHSPAETDVWLDRWAAAGPLVGVRHLIHRQTDPDWVLRPPVIDGLRIVADRDLAFDVCAESATLLAHVPTLTARVPALRLIIDHLAKPPIHEHGWQPWADLLHQAAQSPKVYAKISGLNTAADHTRWTHADFRPYVEHALDVFGAARLMVASDWPFALLAAKSYEHVWTATLDALPELDDDQRSAVLGSTARSAYRLP